MLIACDPSDTGDPGGNGGSTGSGTSAGFPRTYEGDASTLTSRSITYGDMSLIECPSTDTWQAVLDAAGGIVISGTITNLATDDGNTTMCAAIDDLIIMRGTHDSSGAFNIDYQYESTIEPIRGTFDGDRLLGSYDAEFTGTLPGFGELTKEERVTWNLPLTQSP